MAQLFTKRKVEMPTIIDAALKGEYDYIIDRTGGGLSARENLAARLLDITKTWAEHGEVPVSLIMAALKVQDIPTADLEAIKMEVLQMQQMAQQAAMMQMAGAVPTGPGNGAPK